MALRIGSAVSPNGFFEVAVKFDVTALAFSDTLSPPACFCLSFASFAHLLAVLRDAWACSGKSPKPLYIRVRMAHFRAFRCRSGKYPSISKNGCTGDLRTLYNMPCLSSRSVAMVSPPVLATMCQNRSESRFPQRSGKCSAIPENRNTGAVSAS